MNNLNIFLIYSILGFFFELVMCLFMKKRPKSGIMYGPWTPIYGIGVLIMLLVKHTLERFHLNKLVELILFFVIIVIVLMILEQLGGVLLDKVFHKTLWDYRDLKFPITKYIALEVSVGWGLASIIIAYVIQPAINRLLKHIPYTLTIIFFIIFIIDGITTILNKCPNN